ncbi:MAG: heavy metal-binding domain-containing protein [Saprospiraceae bacterium]|nr:heavy metal-binding domain-containing protein [Saprospiraceae bacterium]
MKLLKNLSMLALLLAAGMWIASCGQSESHDSHSHEDGTEHSHDASEAHGEGAAFTSAYVCPMHCEGSGSDEPGTCPACGMDYVAHADHVKDGHKH